MKLHELKLTSHANAKRVGRGIGSGSGKTAGRGMNGQNARSGGGVKMGFEGGQTKLSRRLPKARGFTAVHPFEYQVVNLDKIEVLAQANTVITKELLEKHGFVSASKPVKVLGSGTLTKKITLQVDAVSASAQKAIEACKGTFESTKLPDRPKVEKKVAKSKE